MGVYKRQREQEEAGAGMIKKSSCVVLVVMALLVGAFIGNAVTMLYVGQRQAPTSGASAPGSATPVPGPTVDQESLTRLEQAAADNPTNADVWVNLGNFCFDNGMPERAVKAYEHALELSPMRADVWSDLGVMYRQTTRFQKAIGAFEQAARIDTQHTTSRYNMGIVYYYDLNDRDSALRVWKGLLAENPDAKTPDGRSLADMIREVESK